MKQDHMGKTLRHHIALFIHLNLIYGKGTLLSWENRQHFLSEGPLRIHGKEAIWYFGTVPTTLSLTSQICSLPGFLSLQEGISFNIRDAKAFLAIRRFSPEDIAVELKDWICLWAHLFGTCACTLTFKLDPSWIQLRKEERLRKWLDPGTFLHKSFEEQ